MTTYRHHSFRLAASNDNKSGKTTARPSNRCTFSRSCCHWYVNDSGAGVVNPWGRYIAWVYEKRRIAVLTALNKFTCVSLWNRSDISVIWSAKLVPCIFTKNFHVFKHTAAFSEWREPRASCTFVSHSDVAENLSLTWPAAHRTVFRNVSVCFPTVGNGRSTTSAAADAMVADGGTSICADGGGGGRNSCAYNLNMYALMKSNVCTARSTCGTQQRERFPGEISR